MRTQTAARERMSMTFGKTEETGRTQRPAFKLGIPGFTYLDLHRADRLADLHRAFLADLGAQHADLAARWARHCDGSERLTGPAESELLIELARHLAQFLARAFGIEGETAARRDFLVKR